MSSLTSEVFVPTIVLVEQQTFVSESVAKSLRAEFKWHNILECGDCVFNVENNFIDLKMVVITNSMLLNIYEQSKICDCVGECFGEIPIALLGNAADMSALEFLERYNLKGVFPDETPTNTLIAGLKFILEGGQYFPHKSNTLKALSSSEIAVDEISSGDRFASTMLMSKTADTVDPFTKRERAVLDCLAKGQPNKVIARQLEIAENTIKIHIRNILKKLSVSNRTEAVLAAHKMSLVELH